MDCSVTNRKGCNYCLRSKNIPSFNSYEDIQIDDENKILDVDCEIEYGIIKTISININHCPICGKEL